VLAERLPDRAADVAEVRHQSVPDQRRERRQVDVDVKARRGRWLDRRLGLNAAKTFIGIPFS
jgi:hypothetical protein